MFYDYEPFGIVSGLRSLCEFCLSDHPAFLGLFKIFHALLHRPVQYSQLGLGLKHVRVNC